MDGDVKEFKGVMFKGVEFEICYLEFLKIWL